MVKRERLISMRIILTKVESTLEFVKLIIWWLALNKPKEVAGMLWGVNLRVKLFKTGFVLKIGLSIKILRLNISKATWIAWFYQNEICGEIFILSNFHNLSDP